MLWRQMSGRGEGGERRGREAGDGGGLIGKKQPPVETEGGWRGGWKG